MYAGAQKEGLNLDRIIEEVKMRMARYQVRVFYVQRLRRPALTRFLCPQVVPNTLIVPPQLSYYMSMVRRQPPSALAGPVARAAP